MMLTRLFRFCSFISICRVHPFALAFAMTRAVSSQLRLMHIEEAGVRAEVSAVQTCIRMRTWPGNHGDGTVAVCQSLGKDVASEPAEVAGIEWAVFLHYFAGHIYQRSLQIFGEFFPHRGVMDVCVTARHLRPEMAEIALNEVMGHAEVDHSRSDRVAELM